MINKPPMIANTMPEPVVTPSPRFWDASWKYPVLDAWRGRKRRSEWLNLNIVEIVDRRRHP